MKERKKKELTLKLGVMKQKMVTMLLRAPMIKVLTVKKKQVKCQKKVIKNQEKMEKKQKKMLGLVMVK